MTTTVAANAQVSEPPLPDGHDVEAVAEPLRGGRVEVAGAPPVAVAGAHDRPAHRPVGNSPGHVGRVYRPALPILSGMEQFADAVRDLRVEPRWREWTEAALQETLLIEKFEID